MKTVFSIAIFFSLVLSINAQHRVGDPGITFDTTNFDPDYPQMLAWTTAGVRGGIPFLDSLIFLDTLKAGSKSIDLNAAIGEVSGKGGGAILLENGVYDINQKVTMKSNVYLVGQNRDSVKCIINSGMTANTGAFEFLSGVKNSGIYTLTIEGGWGRPKYDWNMGINDNHELKGNENISVKFKDSEDCFLDKVNIFNSADFPVRCSATHTTFRDLYVDGCFNKAGGAQGYFFLLEGYNLVTGCRITHLRHISLQGDGVKFNVIYDNYFEQEISFHSGDDGNNLIENNRVIIPESMPGFDNPNYYAIMGPWSLQHQISSMPNYLFNNQCLQLNKGHNNSRPWSDPDIVYYGPHKVKPADPYTNFTEYSKGLPDGGTLYPIIADVKKSDFAPYVHFLNPRASKLSQADSLFVEIRATDDDSIANVKLYLNDEFISQKESGPYTWGSDEDRIRNLELGEYILKAVAEDTAGQTTVRIVSISVVDFVPTVKFTLPTSRYFTIEDTVPVAVDASDDKELIGVSLFLDDQLVGMKDKLPFEWGKEDKLLQNMEEGSYTLKVIAEDNAGQKTEAIKAIVIEEPNSILGEEAYENDIEVFPNPFSTGFYVPNTQNKYSYLKIYDTCGKEIHSQKIEGMELIAVHPDIEMAPEGIYILRLIGDEEVQSIKLLRKQ